MIVIFLIVFFLSPIMGQAATLEWERNSESDMKDYQVYACFTPNCVLVKSSSTLLPGTIPQPLPGVKPSAIIELSSKIGFIAITARDQSLNESGLSVPLPFDFMPPSIPINLIFK